MMMVLVYAGDMWYGRGLIVLQMSLQAMSAEVQLADEASKLQVIPTPQKQKAKNNLLYATIITIYPDKPSDRHTINK